MNRSGRDFVMVSDKYDCRQDTRLTNQKLIIEHKVSQLVCQNERTGHNSIKIFAQFDKDLEK